MQPEEAGSRRSVRQSSGHVRFRSPTQARSDQTSAAGNAIETPVLAEGKVPSSATGSSRAILPSSRSAIRGPPDPRTGLEGHEPLYSAFAGDLVCPALQGALRWSRSPRRSLSNRVTGRFPASTRPWVVARTATLAPAEPRLGLDRLERPAPIAHTGKTFHWNAGCSQTGVDQDFFAVLLPRS